MIHVPCLIDRTALAVCYVVTNHFARVMTLYFVVYRFALVMKSEIDLA